MSKDVGPEEAKINALRAARREDLEALQRGKVEAAVERVDAYLREQLPEGTEVNITALARRAVNAARDLA